jgi:dihydropteroate synthase
MTGPIWRTSRFAIDLARPRVMGIVNVTPDSFSEGGAGLTTAQAIARCEQLLADGADILDIGGESSRPGALPVDADEELARVRPVLEAAVELGCAVSIDTSKLEVMRVALDLGVDIVNDIGALRAPGAIDLVAAHPTCGVCLMHMRGTPRSMQAEAVYDDVTEEVTSFLRERIGAARGAGIGEGRIVVDPGIGFGKTPAHNLEILAHQEALLALGVPVLVGWSRKSTLARLAGLPGKAPIGRTPAEQSRLEAASVVAAVLAVERGARIVRVHDVAATVAGLAVWRAAQRADNRADLSTDRPRTP